MQSAAKIKEHYAFNEEDAGRLLRLKEFMEPARERAAEEFYRFILATPEILPLLENHPERAQRHRTALAWWFGQLLRGDYDDRFKITIFLGVALVAFIREILITSLQHGSNPQVGYFLLGAILTIGIVSWLITRAESHRGSLGV